MEAQVVAWIGAFSYPAVVLLLVLCGLGAPLSEELIVITGGLVAAESGASLPLMMGAAYVGTVAGDSLLFHFGRSLGPRLLAHPRLSRVLTPARVLFLQARFARHGALTVLLARLLPGLRAPSFLLAGATGFSFRRFLLADGLGALLTAPLVTWLGFRFGPSVLAQVRGGLRWLVAGALVVGACVLVTRLLRRRDAVTAPAPTPVVEPKPPAP